MIDYPQVYEGSLPYVFVSYAHKDTDIVLPLIRSLIEKGYRVWYDGGLECGTEWPMKIATHLKNSACMIVFLSENSCRSYNCTNEIAYGQNKKIKTLVVYLHENFTVPDDIELILVQSHAIYRNRHPNNASFLNELFRSEFLQQCRQIPSDPASSDADLADRYRLQGDFFKQNDKRNLAMESYQAAAAIYGRLTGKEREAYMSEMADCYSSLGLLYYENGRYIEAADMLAQSIDLYAVLSKDADAEVKNGLVSTFGQLAEMFRMSGYDKCAKLLFDKVDALRAHKAYDPDDAEAHKAAAERYSEENKTELAEVEYKAAIDIYEHLTGDVFAEHRLSLSACCVALGTLYWEADRLSEAEHVLTRGLDIYQACIETAQDANDLLADFADLVGEFGCMFRQSCYHAFADRLFRRALTIYEKLEKQYPGTFGDRIRSLRAQL